VTSGARFVGTAHGGSVDCTRGQCDHGGQFLHWKEAGLDAPL